MRLSYLPLIIALSLTTTNQVFAQNESDPGASGVIDGSNVRQFLDSGARFSPTRMEEASRRFDKMIKLPNRVRQAKNWDEVIKRDRGLLNQSQTKQTTTATEAVKSTGSGATKTSSATESKTKKFPVARKVGRGLERAAEVVGFPISDEFLPGDVDASLAGDLPKGQDPRVYVHPKLSKKQQDAKKKLLDAAENRGASAEDILQGGNGQAPALFTQE